MQLDTQSCVNSMVQRFKNLNRNLMIPHNVSLLPEHPFLHMPLPPPSPYSVLILKSELLDGNGKLAVLKVLDVREKHQSGTCVRLEYILAVNTKFDKA
jgi:hypothetical protein